MRPLEGLPWKKQSKVMVYKWPIAEYMVLMDVREGGKKLIWMRNIDISANYPPEMYIGASITLLVLLPHPRTVV